MLNGVNPPHFLGNKRTIGTIGKDSHAQDAMHQSDLRVVRDADRDAEY